MPIVWLMVAVSAILFFVVDFVIWLLTFWWDKRLWILHRYSCFWAMCYIWVNPFWKINLQGKENRKKGQTYIIISNHQSAFDIVLLYRLWMHFKWVAKRELFRVPVIGWNLWLNKHIVINRGNRADAQRMINEAHENLDMGNSILIFPEGTRSASGAIGRFKDGAFLLAKRSNYPILPVVIEGSREIFPKNGYLIKGRQTMQMKILEPIEPEQYKDKEVRELAREMQQLFEEHHSKMAPLYYNQLTDKE